MDSALCMRGCEGLLLVRPWRCQSYATLSASLPFWATVHEAVSEWYWLLLSYLIRGFGGKLFFSFFVQSSRPDRSLDMSLQGAEQGTMPKSNTTLYLNSPFLQLLDSSTSCGMNSIPNVPPALMPMDVCWAWFPHFSRHVLQGSSVTSSSNFKPHL